jgi:hypothetical protein
LADPTELSDRQRIHRRRHPVWVKDAIALTGVILIGPIVLLPVLVHGGIIGPFDILSDFGPLGRAGNTVHNPMTLDQVTQMIPWTKLAWTQVHAGHIPLWNSYSGLGLPLAFNWQSAPFGLPALLGYLAPLQYAFTVQWIATLVIAGTGVYVLCRVLGLSVWACVFTAIVFELSGPIVAWLGWPVSSVVAWAGWLFAAGLLVVKGRRRAVAIAFLAVALAASIYSGQLDMLVVLLTLFIVFLAALLAQRTKPFRGSGPVLRPFLDLVVAFAAGFGLAAPLILPGVQLARGSIRVGQGAADSALPAINLVNFAFQGYDGLPINGGHWFGIVPYPNYPEYSAYVGIIVLVFAVAGVAFRRHRAETKAFIVLFASAAAIAFFPPANAVARLAPMTGAVRWHRSLILMVFAVAILAGMGVDVLMRRPARRTLIGWLFGGFGAATLLLSVMWIGGSGHLDAADAHVRAQSFVWPAIECAVGLIVVAILALLARQTDRSNRLLVFIRANRARLVAAVLLVCESAFLISAGAPLATSSSTFLPATSGELALKQSVGTSLVGLGGSACPGHGLPPFVLFQPEANDAYGIKEFAISDPLFPNIYNQSWFDATGQRISYRGTFSVSEFCPLITSVKVARLYGISYVVEPSNRPGPPGTILDRTIGDETVYRVPDAASATLTPLPSSGRYPPNDAAGTPVDVTDPTPSTWRMETNAASPQVLRIRLTGVPGWHATIDGKPLSLAAFASVMLQARIPPGHHVVELHYWPNTFTLGIAVAVLSVVFLATLIILEHRKRGRLSNGGSSQPEDASDTYSGRA